MTSAPQAEGRQFNPGQVDKGWGEKEGRRKRGVGWREGMFSDKTAFPSFSVPFAWKSLTFYCLSHAVTVAVFSTLFSGGGCHGSWIRVVGCRARLKSGHQVG